MSEGKSLRQRSFLAAETAGPAGKRRPAASGSAKSLAGTGGRLGQFFKRRLDFCLNRPLSALLRLLVWLCAALTIGILLFLIAYILVKGVPYLTPSLFEWNYNSVNVSLMPALINTILMTLLSLLLAGPIGVFSAIYMTEYAKRGNKVVRLIQVTSQTLAGIPSIVYGLFGMLFFVNLLDWKLSLLSGAFTLAIMILPLIMNTTEEALKSVPDTYREGSFGLGAGRLRTVFRIVLPSAAPGILAGVILAVGRIVGETAALLYTAGSVAQVPAGKDFLFDSVRTLSVHMYALSSEALYTNQAFATAVVLLVIVILINGLSNFVAKRVTKG